MFGLCDGTHFLSWYCNFKGYVWLVLFLTGSALRQKVL